MKVQQLLIMTAVESVFTWTVTNANNLSTTILIYLLIISLCAKGQCHRINVYLLFNKALTKLIPPYSLRDTSSL